MGKNAKQSRYGTLFTEPHSVALVDMDGDGLKDIVTGRTYYSHHKQSPMWDAGAVVYWFKLVRTKDGRGLGSARDRRRLRHRPADQHRRRQRRQACRTSSSAAWSARTC